ncbi:hypothetical protein Ahy_A06g026615 isoform A [Arachis hypogaea]|uniref:RING-type E3 ubiquitin transferase n=1 Tax=Arachis hypogaea TaxID=3818 RepID=A0A445CL44_ARAHY|nr:hypothetical protein Ahy_A06g026615 isoform A [Arachis hypogaea]
MAPGGSIFKEVLESHLMSSDYETGKAKYESKTSSTVMKSCVGLNGKNGLSSKNGVYDLLECPVCKNLMYPPIHQCHCNPLSPYQIYDAPCLVLNERDVAGLTNSIAGILGIARNLLHIFLSHLRVLGNNKKIKSTTCVASLVFLVGSPKRGCFPDHVSLGCRLYFENTCPNGHTLCSNCKIEVHNLCPTCHHDLENIRCLALEKVAESLELPCRYQSLGCHDIFPYYTKLKHEQNCRLRPFSCPYAGAECSVMGDIPSLVSHLKDDHKVDMHNGCTFNHRYVKANPHEVENATWMLTVFNSFGRYFCLHFEAFQLGTAPVYMAFLRFMGDDNEAKKFSYSLEVGASGRKLIWQGIPRSIRDSHRKVRDSQDGLIIPRSLALYFSGGDGKELKLRITGRIWKED